MKVTTRWERPKLVHAIATCHNCEWGEQNHLFAVEEARKHVRKTGHIVDVETGYAQTYNPKRRNNQ